MIHELKSQVPTSPLNLEALDFSLLGDDWYVDTRSGDLYIVEYGKVHGLSPNLCAALLALTNEGAGDYEVIPAIKAKYEVDLRIVPVHRKALHPSFGFYVSNDADPLPRTPILVAA